MTDVLVVGAGTAGLTAAIYACRTGLSCTVLESESPGGQILNSPEVENFPALPKVSGFDFSMALYKQAQESGAKIEFADVLSANIRGRAKHLETTEGYYEGKTLIIANGAKRRKLGCAGEERLAGRGVSYCATCDGAFFRGKDVAMVGGGNTAMEDSLFLSTLCNKVYIIHRRDSFRASNVLTESVKQRGNIELVMHGGVESINGENAVESLSVKDLKTGEIKNIPVSAVFIAVGLVPDNGAFAGDIELDKSGYIVAGENCRTNIEGVYAAGDTRTKQLRQLVTAAADGAVAAFEAANYLNTGGF